MEEADLAYSGKIAGNPGKKNHLHEIVPPAAIFDTNDSNRHTDIRGVR